MSGVCSGRGSCGDRGQCICDYGYIGDNCQFECPGFDPLNKFESAANICTKKGSCTVSDTTGLDYLPFETKNRNRFFDVFRKFYDECDNIFKATSLEWQVQCLDQGATCLEDGLKKFVGETCTSNDECHTNICDTSGTYHGCQGKCVRTAPELFPNPNGWLMKFEPKEDGGLSETWRDFNCPEYQDHLYNHMDESKRYYWYMGRKQWFHEPICRCFQFWYRKNNRCGYM